MDLVARVARTLVAELQIFLSAKICRAISLPHTSWFANCEPTNRVEGWRRLIQNQDDAHFTEGAAWLLSRFLIGCGAREPN